MKNGDKLICTVSGQWVKDKTGWFGITRRVKTKGPKKDEIVTFAGNGNPGFIFLKEYYNDGSGFDERCFSPLVSDDVLEKELNEISEKA